MLRRRQRRVITPPTLDNTHRLSREIGEAMERLGVLIALRKASESHTTGKKGNRRAGHELKYPQKNERNGHQEANPRL